MFRVNQKVVCVEAAWDVHGFEKTPQCGAVYTIREIFTDTASGCAFALHEIVNRPAFYKGAVGIRFVEKRWRSSNFRPLVSRKTDISIFKAMLKPTEVNA